MSLRSASQESNVGMHPFSMTDYDRIAAKQGTLSVDKVEVNSEKLSGSFEGAIQLIRKGNMVIEAELGKGYLNQNGDTLEWKLKCGNLLMSKLNTVDPYYIKLKVYKKILMFGRKRFDTFIFEMSEFIRKLRNRREHNCNGEKSDSGYMEAEATGDVGKNLRKAKLGFSFQQVRERSLFTAGGGGGNPKIARTEILPPLDNRELRFCPPSKPAH